MSSQLGSGVLEDDSPTKEGSLPHLLTEMTRDMSLLVRKEVELAKVEAKEQVGRLGKGVGMFAGAAAFGYLSLLLLSFSGAWA
ncbi:MAG: phage holin family protein, partial [Acidimicrobiia bacterium]